MPHEAVLKHVAALAYRTAVCSRSIAVPMGCLLRDRPMTL